MYNVYFYFSSSVYWYLYCGIRLVFIINYKKRVNFFFDCIFFLEGKELKVPSRYCFCKEK